MSGRPTTEGYQPKPSSDEIDLLKTPPRGGSGVQAPEYAPSYSEWLAEINRLREEIRAALCAREPIPVTRGCICPPGSEKTCCGLGCPRRDFTSGYASGLSGNATRG